MCMMLYMASDHPLPEIPWDKTKPAFFVTSELEPKAELIRSIFTKPHVYYVGSIDYCGCGFSYETEAEYERLYEGYPDLLDRALTANAHGRENTRCLREYLEAAVEQGDVELYASWCSEAKEPSSRLQVGPSYFTGEEAGIYEGQYLTVRKGLTRLGI